MYSDVKCIDILVLAAKKKISSRKWTSHFFFWGGVGGGNWHHSTSVASKLSSYQHQTNTQDRSCGSNCTPAPPITANSNHNLFPVDVVVLREGRYTVVQILTLIRYRPKHRLGLFCFAFFFFFVLAFYSARSLIDPVGIISMGFFLNYRKVQIKFISFN